MQKMESAAMFAWRWWKPLTGFLTFLGFYINKYLSITKELASIRDAVHSCKTDSHYARITRQYCNNIVPKWDDATPVWDAGKEMCADAWEIFASQVTTFFTFLYIYWPLFVLLFLVVLHYTWKCCFKVSKAWNNGKKLMRRESIQGQSHPASNPDAFICTPIPQKRQRGPLVPATLQDELTILQNPMRRVRVEELDEDDDS